MVQPPLPEICQKCIWGSGAILTYITWFITVVLWSTLLWFIKKKFLDNDLYMESFKKDMNHRFDKIEEKQDNQEKLYYRCREELPTVFTPRENTKDLIKRVNEIEKTQSRLVADVSRCLESARKCEPDR